MLVGTHHKMGTVLIEQILLEIVKMQGPNASVAKPHWSSCTRPPPPKPLQPVRRAPACIDEHVQQPPARPPWVHLVRDPVEVAISDYQYSRTGAEGWLRACPRVLIVGYRHLDGCGAALRAAQSALEYPASGREGLEATSALRRRWLRAITVRSEVRPPQLLNTRFGSEVSLPVEVIDF